ncbi:hypothetical protein D9758_012400 [Tetrapyrgos nigripes]|uniref:Retrotransposon gag domain-containing protein n=1 Tax=Tetrapyrgos nigripes TaxID=182062 RepID=A0A8H5D6H9_9AGAR|nr:hypothetical protein D9758_012400 [Tetrapyrgos nigripes]
MDSKTNMFTSTTASTFSFAPETSLVCSGTKIPYNPRGDGVDLFFCMAWNYDPNDWFHDDWWTTNNDRLDDGWGKPHDNKGWDSDSWGSWGHHTPTAIWEQDTYDKGYESSDSQEGKATDVEVFIDSVQDAVELLGRNLAMDRQKCIYMATLFAEALKQWYCAIRSSQPDLLDSFTNFIASFQTHFGKSNLAYLANNKLKKLVQTRLAGSYTSHYLELFIHVNWTEDRRIDNFYNGLKSTTKDLIANTPRTNHLKSFLDYSQWVITCDNQVHEREQEHCEEGNRELAQSHQKPRVA